MALPQHLLKNTNKKVTKSRPKSMAANDNAKPLLQTKSPVVQKVKMFLLK